jgi:hypothetical protein
MLPALNKQWAQAFRHKDTEDAIVTCLGIDVVPRLFLHPHRMLFAMASEKPQTIRLELATAHTPPRLGFMYLKATNKDDQFTLFCKIEAVIGSNGMEELFLVTRPVQNEPELLNMMMDVKAVFVRHGLKMT